MSRNAYMGTLRLSSHPAFSLRDGRLHCPRGCGWFSRVTDYDRHVLAHNLTSEEAWRWLSGRTWDREKQRRGWVTPQDGNHASD